MKEICRELPQFSFVVAKIASRYISFSQLLLEPLTIEAANQFTANAIAGVICP